MDTARIYYDMDDNPRPIHWMVRNEPEWAANRVQAGEDAIAELTALRARVAELEQAADGARLELIENDEDSRENAIAVLRAALAKEGE